MRGPQSATRRHIADTCGRRKGVRHGNAELTLNLKKTNIAPPVITVHQGDSAEVLKAAIYDGDKKAP